MPKRARFGCLNDEAASKAVGRPSLPFSDLTDKGKQQKSRTDDLIVLKYGTSSLEMLNLEPQIFT